MPGRDARRHSAGTPKLVFAVNTHTHTASGKRRFENLQTLDAPVVQCGSPIRLGMWIQVLAWDVFMSKTCGAVRVVIGSYQIDIATTEIDYQNRISLSISRGGEHILPMSSN